MRIQSELHIGSHPDRDAAEGYSFTNGEPHAMGLIKVPLEDIGQHPRLQEIYDALPKDAQQFVQKEGNLALSHDFTFNEEYKEGQGMVIQNLSLDVSRLKDGDKKQIGGWIQEQYGVTASTDAELQQASRSQAHHITTDMTMAGMSRDAMTNMLNGSDPGFASPEDLTKMRESLQSRGVLSANPVFTAGSADMQRLDAYHETAKSMEQRWPNPQSEAYGGETPDEGKVIFFKGFEAAGGEYIKAGPYAYSAAWPGNAEYDKNGVARGEGGKPLSFKNIEADADYVYPPNGVLAKSYEGQQATQIIDNFFAGNTTSYDGFDKNCAGVSGRAVFGNDFADIADRGKKNDKLWDPDHVQAMNDNGKLPQGMAFHQVEVSGADMSIDQNALHASTKAVEAQQGSMLQQRQQQQPAAETAQSQKPDFSKLSGLADISKTLAAAGVSAKGGSPAASGVQREQGGRGIS